MMPERTPLSRIPAQNPATRLLGKTLEGGWHVIEIRPRNTEASGAHFSVGYIVEGENGQRGYLKALDFERALSGGNIAERLGSFLDAYRYELQLLHRCRERKLSRSLSW